MDAIDQQLIQLTEAGLPLVAEPYHCLGTKIGISGNEVQQRLSAMQEQGIIRRIAAVPNHYRLGYRFNGMSVWDVEDAVIDKMGQSIGALDFVSHCYHRPRHLPIWPYNLFAMIHAKTELEANTKIEHIAELLGGDCKAQDVLYSTEILKKTGFRSANKK